MRPVIRKCCCSLLELQQTGMSHTKIRSYIHANWSKPPLASIDNGFLLHQSTIFLYSNKFQRNALYKCINRRLPFSLGLKKRSCKIGKKLRINIRSAKSLRSKQRLLKLWSSAVYPSQLQLLHSPHWACPHMDQLSLKKLRPRLPFYQISNKTGIQHSNLLQAHREQAVHSLFSVPPKATFQLCYLCTTVLQKCNTVQSIFTPLQKQPRPSHNNPLFHHKFFQKIHKIWIFPWGEKILFHSESLMSLNTVITCQHILHIQPIHNCFPSF